MRKVLAEASTYAVTFLVLTLAVTVGLSAHDWLTGPTTEDSPGFDCLVDGNQVCRINGHLVLNLDDMPTDPYGRCVWLLQVPDRLLSDVSFAASDICADEIGANR